MSLPEEPSTPPGIQDALVRVARRLELPQPQRARILEEIAADLEELRVGLMDRGVPAREAEARAIRLLVPSETSIEALVQLYEPFHRKLTRRFSPSVMRGVERSVLMLVTLGTLAFAVSGLLRSGALNEPSPLLWAVFGLAGGILLLAGRKAVRLLLVRDHDPRNLRDGLGLLLVGSGGALGLGATGAVLQVRDLAIRVQRTGEASVDVLVPWLLDSSILLAAALVTALVGGLCWFLLLHKVHAVERAHRRTAQAVGRSHSEILHS